MTVTALHGNEDSIKALWLEYAARPTLHLRERLIQQYLPLVKYVAGRVSVGLPPNTEQADLVSYGILGLIDAISKFDPSLGNKFETYAVSRIKGQIIDELRELDHAPRSVRKFAKDRDKAIEDLRQRIGSDPFEDEVAAELELNVKDYRAKCAEADRLVGQISLQALVSVEDDHLTLTDTLACQQADPERIVAAKDELAWVFKQVKGMSDRSQYVFSEYYLKDVTLANIGVALGVTESRVCQIHREILYQLKHRRDKAMTVDTEVRPDSFGAETQDDQWDRWERQREDNGWVTKAQVEKILTDAGLGRRQKELYWERHPEPLTKQGSLLVYSEQIIRDDLELFLKEPSAGRVIPAATPATVTRLDEHRHKVEEPAPATDELISVQDYVVRRGLSVCNPSALAWNLKQNRGLQTVTEGRGPQHPSLYRLADLDRCMMRQKGKRAQLVRESVARESGQALPKPTPTPVAAAPPTPAIPGPRTAPDSVAAAEEEDVAVLPTTTPAVTDVDWLLKFAASTLKVDQLEELTDGLTKLTRLLRAHEDLPPALAEVVKLEVAVS